MHNPSHEFFVRGRKPTTQKLEITSDLLEQWGASGKSYAEIAKDHGVTQTVVSRAINKTLTTRESFEKGRLKTNVR